MLLLEGDVFGVELHHLLVGFFITNLCIDARKFKITRAVARFEVNHMLKALNGFRCLIICEIALSQLKPSQLILWGKLYSTLRQLKRFPDAFRVVRAVLIEAAECLEERWVLGGNNKGCFAVRPLQY